MENKLLKCTEKIMKLSMNYFKLIRVGDYLSGVNITINDGNNNQNLKLLNFGNVTFGILYNKNQSQFLNLPKIIIKLQKKNYDKSIIIII